MVIKSMVSGSSNPRSSTYCLALGSLRNLSVPRFPSLQNEIISVSNIIRLLGGLNGSMNVNITMVPATFPNLYF